MTTPIFAADRPDARLSRNDDDHFLRARAEEDIIASFEETPSRVAVIAPTTKILDAHIPAFDRFDAAPLEAGDPDRLLSDTAWRASPGQYDLVIAIGVIERCNDPALALGILGGMLRPGGQLVGAIVGGESLSTLRAALIQADSARSRVAIRIHPMIDGSGLASLLSSVGLHQPVVSLDRVEVRYRAARRLVGDLRAMGCSRRLVAPSPPLNRSQWNAVKGALGSPFIERFDLLHFRASAHDA